MSLPHLLTLMSLPRTTRKRIAGEGSVHGVKPFTTPRTPLTSFLLPGPTENRAEVEPWAGLLL